LGVHRDKASLVEVRRIKKQMKRFLAFLFISIVLAVLTFNIASAQQPTPSDDEVNSIARQLYCPVCENTPLDVCPTAACHDWRELIRQMLSEGKTQVQIKQYFVDHYGARVLAKPPAVGLNWLIYLVPPLAFLVGVYLLIQAFRIWRRQKKEQPENSDGGTERILDDSYLARIEEELRKRK
jgi:cytochrome c-type biogenesis protein CcmH